MRLIKSAAAILAKADSTDTEKLIAAAEDIKLSSPFGADQLPQGGSSIDPRRVRRQDLGQRRQGRDGQFGLSQRR